MLGNQAYIRDRTLGGLTGTRVAQQLGRVLVLHTAQCMQEVFGECSWTHEHIRCSFISWVDNAFFAGRDPVSACYMADEFERLLKLNWQQDIKPTSRLLLAPAWWSYCDEESPKYPVVQSMVVLGQMVSHSCSVSGDVEFQHARVRASFFRNGGHKFAAKLSTAARLRLVKISDLSTIRSVWARWPWTQRRCADLDSWQAELIRWTMKIRKEDDEIECEFIIRRNRLVKEVAKEQGLWSLLYSKAVSDWALHIQRNHVGALHGELMGTLTPLYLQTLRNLSRNNRPHTRRLPGGFPVRWCESISRADAAAGTRHLGLTERNLQLVQIFA